MRACCKTIRSAAEALSKAARPAKRTAAVMSVALAFTAARSSPPPAAATEATGVEFAFITTTDYTTGSAAVIHLDGSYTTQTGVAAIHSDATARWYDGLVYVINREGADNIQVLDPADGFRTLAQHSTGNGSNPKDIAFHSPQRAFVSRNDSNALLIMNPLSGQHLGTVDLSIFADGDGLCEMDHLLLAGELLFVSIQRLDRNYWWMPVGDSYVAVIDAATGELIDVDPETPGIQAIALPASNPYSDLKYDGALNRILVSCVGQWGVRDGGIAIINPFTLRSEGLLIDETAAGGDIIEFEILGATKGYMIVATPSFTTRLVPFDPSTGTVGAPLQDPPDWVINDIEISPCGKLFVADQTATAPGIWIWDAGPDTLISPAPKSTGLPPFHICFSAGSVTDAPLPVAAAFGRAYPNPFNPATRIPFSLARPGRVELSVYDSAGRRIRRLEHGILAAGGHEALWNGLDDRGRAVSSGVYFVRLRAGTAEAAQTVVLLR